MPVNRFDRTSYAEQPENDAHEHQPLNGHGPEAVRRLQRQLEELGEYARLYASAKKDGIIATIRGAVLWAIVGLTAAAIGLSVLVTAAVLTMLGLAQLIGEALDGQLWAGYLIAGGGLLLLVLAVLVGGVIFLQARFRKQTVKRYAKRHQDQQTRFGHDATERSRAAERS